MSAFIAISAETNNRIVPKRESNMSFYLVSGFAEVGENSKRLQNRVLKIYSEYCFINTTTATTKLLKIVVASNIVMNKWIKEDV